MLCWRPSPSPTLRADATVASDARAPPRACCGHPLRRVGGQQGPACLRTAPGPVLVPAPPAGWRPVPWQQRVRCRQVGAHSYWHRGLRAPGRASVSATHHRAGRREAGAGAGCVRDGELRAVGAHRYVVTRHEAPGLGRRFQSRAVAPNYLPRLVPPCTRRALKTNHAARLVSGVCLLRGALSNPASHAAAAVSISDSVALPIPSPSMCCPAQCLGRTP